MIVTKNNFLPKQTFASLQNYCKVNEFSIFSIEKKLFSILETPGDIFPFLEKEGYELTLSFIRDAYNGFDTDLNIHADNIVNGRKTDLAAVLYINDTDGVTPNGTRFYEHETHGVELLEDVSNDEFNRLLLEDANDESKWTAVEEVLAYPNRAVFYGSNLFHSKFPKEITEGRRIALVAFYSKKNNDEK